jgi:hypothetical protein
MQGWGGGSLKKNPPHNPHGKRRENYRLPGGKNPFRMNSMIRIREYIFLIIRIKLVSKFGTTPITRRN